MKLRRLVAALLVLVLVLTSSPVVYASAAETGAGQTDSTGETVQTDPTDGGTEEQADPTGSGGAEDQIAPIADPEYQTLSAVDTSYMLWSAAMKRVEDYPYIERADAAGIVADMPYTDSLDSDAVGEFNASGSAWPWFAYKVSVPAAGTYTLGVKTVGCKNASYKIPLCVNNAVYTLNYTAKAQQVTTDVYLSAGEHVVVMFLPMPANEASASGNVWNDYVWCNVEAMIVDSELTVAAPTVAEVEACFAPKADTVIAANNESYILWSNAVSNTNGRLEFSSRDAVKADLPYIDSLYSDAVGEFNKSGEEWGWFAYKISVLTAGTYTLGVETQNCRNAPYIIPLCVNNEVYALNYAATGSQSATVDVPLSAGTHVVVMFMPMPQNAENITGQTWVDYPWCNVQSMIVDYELTVAKPTVAEVEACFAPQDVTISAIDANYVLYSAAVGDNGHGYLEFNQRDAVKADLPHIDTLYSDAVGEFNKSGEEWGWFAYKVSVPAAGTYTLGVNINNCRNAPYSIPLCVNGEVHTLTYAATGAQSAAAEVSLPAGEQVVVMFMPMPQNAAGITGQTWVDYPWCNVSSMIVDYELTVAKPTVAEVEACFAPKTVSISAVDTNYMLWSATVGKNADNLLYCANQEYVRADLPYIDSLYSDAIGQFNKSGEEWNWFAYKVTVPTAGTYTLGVKVNNCKWANYKIPLCVNGEVYTLTYTAKNQEVTAEVTLPAGEHTVVMFMPMPQNAASSQNNAWNDYPWCNVEAMIVDSALTVAKPTVAEVENCFSPSAFSATNARFMLWSATVGSTKENGTDILNCANQTYVRADLPYIDTLISDTWGEFNASGSEWNWFAYKVSAPAAGSYTLSLKVNNCKFASYKIPLYVNNEVYTLTYTAKNQEQTVQVSLPAGEHVVVMFMPMPQNAASAEGNAWNDYPWCNVEAVTVDTNLTVLNKPTVAEVESCFSSYTKINPGDAKVILFNKFTDKGDTLTDAARTEIQADMPTVESLPYSGNLIDNWPFMSMKVTAAQEGDYTIRLNVEVKSDTASKQVGMLLDGVSYGAPIKIQSGSIATVTTSAHLTAGDHVLTFFIPMPLNGASNTKNVWTDYPWINYNSILLESGFTVSKPEISEVTATLGNRVEAENTEYVIYNNYNTPNEANAKASGGMVVGGAWTSTYEQTFEELEAWLDAKHNAYVEYAVVAPADGEYDIRVGFLAGSSNTSIAKPYIAVVVNNTTHKAQFTKDWNQVDAVELTVKLKEGLNIIRCTSMTTDQEIYGARGWINQDFLDLDTRLTPVKHSSVTMEAEDSEYYNKFKVQAGGDNEAASGKVLGSSDRKYIVGQNLTLDTFLYGQLKQVPYFSVTVNAPQNGYYPITVHMSGDGRLSRSTVGMVVDDTVYAVKYARTNATTTGGRVDTLVYLTEGEHVLTFTAPMPADASIKANYSYYWCNYDSITLYDGLTFAKQQKEPIWDPDYTRIEVEDYALFNLCGDNGHAAGNAVYNVSQSLDEIMKNGIDGSRTPYIELTVNAKEAGPYAIFVGTSYGINAGGIWNTVEGKVVVDVNGKLETKSVWITKSTYSTVIPVWIILEEGENTVRLTHLTSDAQHGGTTWIDFDYIEMPYWVTKGIAFVKPGERLEAEDSSFDAFAEEVGKEFSDGACLGRVNYDTVEELEITHDTLDPTDLGGLPHVAYRVFTEKAGTYSLAVGFKAGLTNYPSEEKAQGVDASFTVVVNGETKQRVEFILKGDKNMARIINVDLKEGENEIIVTGTTSEYVIDRKPRNDETYRLVWINQDYLALPAGVTSMSMNEDVTNIDDSDIDFGQLSAKERSEQDAADAPAVEPAETENGFGWLWIVAGIGAAFILFLIFLIGKKRKKEEEEV